MTVPAVVDIVSRVQLFAEVFLCPRGLDFHGWDLPDAVRLFILLTRAKGPRSNRAYLERVTWLPCFAHIKDILFLILQGPLLKVSRLVGSASVNPNQAAFSFIHRYGLVTLL